MKKTSLLSQAVSQAVRQYLANFDNNLAVCNLLELFTVEVEKTLLQEILHATQGNQSMAARWLGVSRNTLRKMMALYVETKEAQ